VSGGNVGVRQRNTVLNRNRRLLLWWSQEKKDVNDVNLQFDNGQSGHGPGGIFDICLRDKVTIEH